MGRSVSEIRCLRQATFRRRVRRHYSGHLAKMKGFGDKVPRHQGRTDGERNNMAGYTLATYQTADGPRAGLVVDDKVFDAAMLTRKPAYATVLGILNDWKSAQGALK